MSLTKVTNSMIVGAVYNLSDFGPIGNSSTGDNATLQAAIDYMHNIATDAGSGGTLMFKGTVYLSAPINFGKNITFQGQGRGFISTIKPLASFSGSYLFGIDGSTCIGGYAFRIRHKSFTIDNSLITTKAQIAKTYYINSAYDIGLDDVWLYNVRGTGIEIGTSNLVVINNTSIYGVSADASHSEFGIRIISGGSGGGAGGVKIINPDIEVLFKGISQEAGSSVQIINPYCERNIIGWQGIGTTSGNLTVVGGEVTSPGASGVAASIAGNNVTVVGGIYTANGGVGLNVDSASRRANINLIGVSGSISDSRNYAQKIVTDPTNWYPSVVTNYKTPASGSATTFFNVICPSNASYFGVCEVTLNARDNSGYSLWTAKYRFAFSNPDATLRTTAGTEYGKTNVNISGNYSLSIVTGLSAAGTTIAFQVTPTTGGALGAGLACRVSASAEMVQWDSAGAVYIQAV